MHYYVLLTRYRLAIISLSCSSILSKTQKFHFLSSDTRHSSMCPSPGNVYHHPGCHIIVITICRPVWHAIHADSHQVRLNARREVPLIARTDNWLTKDWATAWKVKDLSVSVKIKVKDSISTSEPSVPRSHIMTVTSTMPYISDFSTGSFSSSAELTIVMEIGLRPKC